MLGRGRLLALTALTAGVIILLIYASLRQRWSQLRTIIAAVNNEELAGKLKAVPLDYARASEYFELLGYRYCPSKSAAQARNKLWMHLRAPASDSVCGGYFSQFLAAYNSSPEWPPPRTIPASLRDRYLLHGRAAADEWYFAQRYDGNPVPQNWSPSVVQNYIDKALASATFTYRNDTHFVYKVVDDFPFRHQRGLVIGSEVPWLEAILLARGGARKIFTIEYSPINSTYPQIDYVSPAEFSRNWKSFAERRIDFAFTFSSLEHAGLGRYGDRLDPEADIMEMAKLSCILPDNAMVYLGLPIGADTVFWNAHRLYGRWRLPLMTANFDVLALYTNVRLEDPMAFVNTQGYKQAIVVMRNAKGASHEGEC